MGRPVFDVIVQTVWPDGFKSEVRGDAITVTRRTLEAMRRSGVYYYRTVPADLRSAAQAVAVREISTITIVAGLATLNIRCAKEDV